MKTREPFTWRHGIRLETTIPAGAPVEFRPDLNAYLVRPSFFPENSFERHDATYYGCRVKAENVEGAKR